MNSQKFWVVIHGGSTHFPIALLITSLLFDFIGYFVKQEKISREMHTTSFYSLVLGALGCFPAVFSGLMLTHWGILGNGNLKMHHIFVWPAFGLLTALAVWRIIVRDRSSRPAFTIYLGAATVTTILMAAAGYWGGEL